MTVLATATNPRFSVSRIDIDRPGLTYTVDTLRELRESHPKAELFFITGADALAQILDWRSDENMFSMAHFVGVTRPGYQLSLDERFPPGAVSLLGDSGAHDFVLGLPGTGGPRMPIWYLVRIPWCVISTNACSIATRLDGMCHAGQAFL